MPKQFKFFKWYGKKAVAFLVLSVILSLALVGGTIAFIFTYTNSLTNVFTPAKIESTIEGNTVKNIGEAPVYARATVVVSWVNTSDGSTLMDTPVASDDYTITINSAGGWVQATDGFWYYTAPIAPNASTTALVSSAEAVSEKVPDGYKLSVEILSTVIQATPAEAVKTAWTAVTLDDNGNIVVPTSGS